MLYAISRSRALSVAISGAVSAAALAIFIHDAKAQDSTKTPSVAPAAAPAPTGTTSQPAGGGQAANPQLPEVKVIQDAVKPKPVEAAQPKPKKAPAPVVQAEPDPAPAPRLKKNKPKATASSLKPKPAKAAPPLALPETFADAPQTAADAQTEAAAADVPQSINSPHAAEAAAGRLEIKNATGSALKLTPRETPATVNVVSAKDIADKGARGLIETFRAVPGVVVGNNPGEVGTTGMRGFFKATGFAIDGSRVADPVLLPRDYSSFHFDRIEVLKGPASVVSGTSGLAGTINIITKQASTDRTFTEAMVSYGSFDTLQTGVGANIVLSPDAALRSTFTFGNSNGYIDDTPFDKFGFTNNLLFKPTDDLKISLSADFFKDDLKAYYATPLIQRSVARAPSDVVSSTNGLVLDRSIRSTNYDIENGTMESESIWLRGAADYKLSEQWKLRNEVNYYSADRLWQDADFYTFAAGPPPAITRGLTHISHDHEFWSERLVLSFDGDIAGKRNRFAAGGEYMDTNMGSVRRFGATPGVDIFNPVRGTFPPATNPAFTSRQQFSSQHETKAVFAEDAVNLTPQWLVSGGIRYEHITLDREVFNELSLAKTNFGNEFESTTWRVGTSYEVVPGTTVFAQYATAVYPATSALVLSSLANSKFKLTTGDTVEGGIKSTFLGGRVTTTASVYQIEQDDIVTRDPANPTVSIQGGSQRSRGIEAEAAIDLTERWNLSLSGTLIDSEFTKLTGPGGADFTGNRPLNISPWAWSAMTSYRLEGFPATIGAQLVGVGPFFTSNANRYEAKERTLLDAWIAFDVWDGTLRLRGRNLTDEFYAEWGDYNESAVYVGAPRSFDVTYTVKW